MCEVLKRIWEVLGTEERQGKGMSLKDHPPRPPKKVVLVKKTLKNLEHESRKGLILRRETREISLRGASFRLGTRKLFIVQREGASRERN